MDIIGYKVNVEDYIVSHESLGYNKCIGHLITSSLNSEVIKHLFKKMTEKEPWEIDYYDSWGVPEYVYSPKKFFIHFILPDKAIQILEIFYDTIELDTLESYYGRETLIFHVKSENGNLFTSFKYIHYFEESNLYYVLNSDEEVIGAVIKPTSKKTKSISSYSSDSDSDSDIYSIDDFMRDNGYDPDNDTIEDMYNLD